MVTSHAHASARKAAIAKLARGKDLGANGGSEPILLRRSNSDQKSSVYSDCRMNIFIVRNGGGIMEKTNGYALLLSKDKFDVELTSVGNKQSKMQKVNGVIVPPSTIYCVRGNNGPLYVIEPDTQMTSSEHLDSPVHFHMEDVQRHLVRSRPVKFMVPANPYGLDTKREGRLLSNGSPEIVIGPENIEFSAGGPVSRQDFHSHEHLTEVYIPFGNLEIIYHTKEGKLSTIAASAGDVVILKSGKAPHYAIMREGPTFVAMSSHLPIADDKKVVVHHDDIEKTAAGVLRS